MGDKEFQKRRSILNLHFQKFLQYKITTILVMFTFFIGIVIGFLTKQLRVDNFVDWNFVFILSVTFFGVGINFIKELDYHLINIIKKLKSYN